MSQHFYVSKRAMKRIELTEVDVAAMVVALRDLIVALDNQKGVRQALKNAKSLVAVHRYYKKATRIIDEYPYKKQFRD